MDKHHWDTWIGFITIIGRVNIVLGVGMQLRDTWIGFITILGRVNMVLVQGRYEPLGHLDRIYFKIR